VDLSILSAATILGVGAGERILARVQAADVSYGTVVVIMVAAAIVGGVSEFQVR